MSPMLGIATTAGVESPTSCIPSQAHMAPVATWSDLPFTALPWLRATALFAILTTCPVLELPAAERRGRVEIRVADVGTSQPLAVNLFLENSRGRSLPAPNLPFWKDHFAFDGSVVLELPPGQYTFEMERGPEYHAAKRKLRDHIRGEGNRNRDHADGSWT